MPDLISAAPGEVLPVAQRPRVYVACLAAYNAGCLHGRWIEASDPDTMRAEVRAMLAASPEPGAEEHAVHDHEGFEGAPVSEWASFEAICTLADFIEVHGRLGACLYRHFGEDLDAAAAAFDDYAGEYPSLADFAETLHRECGTAIPEALQYYIDWEAIGRDLELNGDVFTVALSYDAVHVFWNR
jgi:antirestriction protein